MAARCCSAVLTAFALLLVAALPASAQTPGDTPGSTATTTTIPATTQVAPNELRNPPTYDRVPEGRRLTAKQAIRIADGVEKIREVHAENRGETARAYLKGATAWQISYFSKPAKPGQASEELGQVVIDDPTGRVIEAWTGFQVAWTMARGYPGAFGRKANALYVWLPLCLAFIVPFLRPPLRMLHLDLLVLLSFSVSYAFFNAAHIGLSVTLSYPPLVYLLARMLWIARERSRGREPPRPLKLLVSPSTLGVAVVFLLGFRIGLNVTASNVIDVGYSGVIGADRLIDGDSLYGAFPPDNPHGDTYGIVNYLAYVPFEQIWPWHGGWGELKSAHGAAVAFDLGAAALLYLFGRRLRGPDLGSVLAYLWAAFPFTLLVSNSNANDSLVAMLVMLALLVAARPVWRGVAVALATLSKFAPIGLFPLFATYRAGLKGAVLTAVGFVVTIALLTVPIIVDGSLDAFWDRTLGFQSDRGSPFSVWGYYGGIDFLQSLVKAGALGLGVLVAFWPRRRDVISVAALGGAVLIALQLTVTHWFYLYIVWFLPLVLVALVAQHEERGEEPPPQEEPAEAAAAPAVA